MMQSAWEWGTLGLGAAALLGVGGGVLGNPISTISNRAQAQTPALPLPRNTSARHFIRSHVTFSSSQINRAQSLWFAMAGCVLKSPVRLFQRVCSGVSDRAQGWPRTVSPYVSSLTYTPG